MAAASQSVGALVWVSPRGSALELPSALACRPARGSAGVSVGVQVVTAATSSLAAVASMVRTSQPKRVLSACAEAGSASATATSAAPRTVAIAPACT